MYYKVTPFVLHITYLFCHVLSNGAVDMSGTNGDHS